jgi:two-component system chemotaxis response regulator CheB
MQALGEELRTKVKSAARVRVRARSPLPPALSPRRTLAFGSSLKIVFVGASTGGVEALMTLLLGLPADCPPILITQHMPPRFTLSFANRLNSECAMTVVEAAHNQPVEPGHVYIAPGSHHLEIWRNGTRLACRLHDGESVSGHRPSVDVLFRSAARVVGRNAVGAILTGMGKDGAEGLLEMRQAEAITLGQDEASSLIYGMPRAAFERGAVMRQQPLESMADSILDACRETKAKAHA